MKTHYSQKTGWFLFFILLSAVILGKTDQASSHDVWWLMKEGEYALKNALRLPDHDIYSYTVTGGEVVKVDWLTKIFFYKLYVSGGFPLLMWVRALFGLIIFSGLAILTPVRKAPEWLAGIGTVAYLGFEERLRLSGDLFTIFCLAFTIVALFHWHTKKNRMALLSFALLLVLWILTHGGWVMGYLLGMSYVIGAFSQKFFYKGSDGEAPDQMGECDWKKPFGVVIVLGIILGIFQFFTPLNLTPPLDYIKLQFSPAYIAFRPFISQYNPDIQWSFLTLTKTFSMVLIFIISMISLISDWKKNLPWLMLLPGFVFLATKYPGRGPAYLSIVSLVVLLVAAPWERWVFSGNALRKVFFSNFLLAVLGILLLVSMKKEHIGSYPMKGYNLDSMKDFMQKSGPGLPPEPWGHDWSLGSMIMWEFYPERKTYADNRIFPFLRNLPPDTIAIEAFSENLTIPEDLKKDLFFNPDTGEIGFTRPLSSEKMAILKSLSMNPGFQEGIKRLQNLAVFRGDHKNYIQMSSQMALSSFFEPDAPPFIEYCDTHEIRTMLLWTGSRRLSTMVLENLGASQHWLLAYMDESVIILIRLREENMPWLRRLVNRHLNYVPPERGRHQADALRDFGSALVVKNLSERPLLWMNPIDSRTRQVENRASRIKKILHVKARENLKKLILEGRYPSQYKGIIWMKFCEVLYEQKDYISVEKVSERIIEEYSGNDSFIKNRAWLYRALGSARQDKYGQGADAFDSYFNGFGKKWFWPEVFTLAEECYQKTNQPHKAEDISIKALQFL